MFEGLFLCSADGGLERFTIISGVTGKGFCLMRRGDSLPGQGSGILGKRVV